MIGVSMPSTLCKYKNIFGKEGEGVHSIRLFNVAIVDVIFTLIGAYFIAKFLKVSLVATIVIVFVIGILAHRLFCVNTTINKHIFGEV